MDWEDCFCPFCLVEIGNDVEMFVQWKLNEIDVWHTEIGNVECLQMLGMTPEVAICSRTVMMNHDFFRQPM